MGLGGQARFWVKKTSQALIFCLLDPGLQLSFLEGKTLVCESAKHYLLFTCGPFDYLNFANLCFSVGSYCKFSIVFHVVDGFCLLL